MVRPLLATIAAVTSFLAVSQVWGNSWERMTASEEAARQGQSASPSPVQLGRPLGFRQDAARGNSSLPIGLGKPTTANEDRGIHRVGLSQPVGKTTIRAQNNDMPPVLHSPTPVGPQVPLPAGPLTTGPLMTPPGPAVPPTGPILGSSLPAGSYTGAWSGWLGGWFDGWFGDDGWFAGVPAPVLPLKGLSFGGGVYILYPHWESNPAYAISTGTGVLRQHQEDFSFHTEFAPYAFISYVGPTGLGLRSRFWRFDQTSTIFLQNDGLSLISSAAPLNLQNSSLGAGDQLMFEGGLQITVIDLEATQVSNWGLWSLQLSGGVRYAHLSQHYNNLEIPASGSFDAISSGHNFRGAGPTLAVEARRDLGFWGLGLYGSARGSLLFGTGRQNAFLVNNGNLLATASASRSDVLPVTELELGLDWCKQIKNCRFFVQAAVVGQVWYGTGNAANNDIIVPAGQSLIGNSADNTSNLGLFGGKLVLGLEF